LIYPKSNYPKSVDPKGIDIVLFWTILSNLQNQLFISKPKNANSPTRSVMKTQS